MAIRGGRHHKLAAPGDERSDAPIWKIGRKVKVKAKFPGQPNRWVDGTVQRTSQGGAFVLINGGSEGFFYHRDIQGAPEPKLREGWEARPEPVRVTVIPDPPSAEPVAEQKPLAPKPDNIASILERAQQTTIGKPAIMNQEAPPRESVIPRIGLPDMDQAPPHVADDETMPFEEFVECLSELVLVPVDRETRRRWLTIARQLHEMTR